MTLTRQQFEIIARELLGMHVSREEIDGYFARYVDHDHLNSEKHPTGDPLTEIAA